MQKASASEMQLNTVGAGSVMACVCMPLEFYLGQYPCTARDVHECRRMVGCPLMGRTLGTSELHEPPAHPVSSNGYAGILRSGVT